jgi:hypothetical protein
MKLVIVLQRRCSKDGRREKQATINPTQPVVVIGLARSVSTFVSRPATFHGRYSFKLNLASWKMSQLCFLYYFMLFGVSKQNDKENIGFLLWIDRISLPALQHHGCDHDHNLRCWC